VGQIVKPLQEPDQLSWRTRLSLRIESMGVVVPGQIVRKYDGTSTTLTITAELARHLHASVPTVIQFFEMSEEQ
jgi:hypothetical protein